MTGSVDQHVFALIGPDLRLSHWSWTSWHVGNLVAITATVDTPTDITKLGTTLAGHVVAAFGFLYPELATVALLEAHTLHVLKELGIVLALLSVDLVLLTCHSLVVDSLAVQTVMLLALRA